MSTISLKDLDKVIDNIELARGKWESAAKQALWEGANIVADQVRANLASKVKGGNGDLSRSLYVGKMNTRGQSTVDTRIGFTGYDRNNVPNPLKAAVLESGRSDQRGRAKTKFFSSAVNATKGRAKEAIAEKLNEYYENLLGD